MRVRLAAAVDRLRSSLFFLPTLAMAVALAVAWFSVEVDSRLDDAADIPLVLTSTVDGARSILSTVAAATISFAGIAFSIALLVIQLASSQYSPRVVHTLFRDPFNRRIVALVVGTFTYCIVVLRSVRGPLEQGGEAVIPNLSVAIAVLLGIGSILGIVAFINHSAHSMDVSEILQQATAETISQVHAAWEPADQSVPPPAAVALEPADLVIRVDEGGWLQRLDLRALEALVPPGGSLELHSSPGRYVVAGAALCSVAGAIDDPARVEAAVHRSVVVGASRTMQHDPMYGLRQIVDVGVRALSPGINDPTTAQDAIFHMAAVVTEMLRHDPPPPVRSCVGGGQLRMPSHSHDDVVALAFDELRRAAAPHPTVSIYLLEAIGLIRRTLALDGLVGRADELDRQAELVLRGSDAADNLLDEDRELVRRAHAPATATGRTRPQRGPGDVRSTGDATSRRANSSEETGAPYR
jgi:uncharacterized membrane protein